jgi:acetyl-CoA acyltransferase
MPSPAQPAALGAAQAERRLRQGDRAGHLIPQRKGDAIVSAADEHPRGDAAWRSSPGLPTPFRGPAAPSRRATPRASMTARRRVIVASEKPAAKSFGLTAARARVLGMAPPPASNRAIMGYGPVPGEPQAAAADSASRSTDFDIVELNEAFASAGARLRCASSACRRRAQVNPNGGAIALGHPLGMSGARLALTAALELHRPGRQGPLRAVHHVHRRRPGHRSHS